MADHLANSWESPVGSLVEGDPIVALSWLHNGVKLALHVEKVGVSPEWDEGISAARPPPSLAPSPAPGLAHSFSPAVTRLPCVQWVTHLTDGSCPQNAAYPLTQ